jgi:hypothetical protein
MCEVRLWGVASDLYSNISLPSSLHIGMYNVMMTFLIIWPLSTRVMALSLED